MPTGNQITVELDHEVMQLLLFDPIDYTDQRIRAVMEGKTCRTCGNRVHCCYGPGSYCNAIGSRRTKNGLLKVKANQPACIRYTSKEKEP